MNSDSSPLHSPEVQFLVGCWEVWQALAGPGDHALRQAHGLTLREFIALGHVQSRPVSTPAWLARQLGLPRYEVSRLLAHLEHLGAVTRSRAQADARQVQVSVTPAGHSLWQAALEQVQALVGPSLSGLGPALPGLGAALLTAAQAARNCPPSLSESTSAVALSPTAPSPGSPSPVSPSSGSPFSSFSTSLSLLQE